MAYIRLLKFFEKAKIANVSGGSGMIHEWVACGSTPAPDTDMGA
jgi:hypothetical protein